MLSLILLVAAVPEAPLANEWTRFERAGALSHVSETVAVATDGTSGASVLEYKVRYTRTTLQGSETLWTNSRTCPAVREVLEGMRDLRMPRPAPYGIAAGSGEIVVDGIGYSLHAPSDFTNGQLTITSNIDSPLATWVDGAFAALKPCWSPIELRFPREK